tara:strand:+ start:142 stop:303 length:162 start_codon:yes stop_codon:yes gene_type:complete
MGVGLNGLGMEANGLGIGWEWAWNILGMGLEYITLKRKKCSTWNRGAGVGEVG